MKFHNPRGKFMEGRLPTKEDNFSEDRYYSDIDNVFVRFDPYKDHIKVIFPSINEIGLIYDISVMEELAKKDLSLYEFVSYANNIESVSRDYQQGYIPFSDDFDWFIKLKKWANKNKKQC